jgi:hypothetical protein
LFVEGPTLLSFADEVKQNFGDTSLNRHGAARLRSL